MKILLICIYVIGLGVGIGITEIANSCKKLKEGKKYI